MVGESLHVCAAALSIVVVLQLVRRLERAATTVSTEVRPTGETGS
jgi:hypothetical protein